MGKVVKKIVKKSAEKEEGPSKLVMAVENLNQVIDLDPPIDSEQDDATLKEEIRNVADLVRDTDDLDDNTWAVLKSLGIKVASGEAEEEAEEKEDEKPAPKKKIAKKEVEEEEEAEEVEEDVAEETETEEEKPVKKKKLGMGKKEHSAPAPVKKGTEKKAVAPAPKKNRPAKKAGEPSNKEIIWKLWKKGKGETDAVKLNKAVKNQLSEKTVRGWMSKWRNGYGLPACAK